MADTLDRRPDEDELERRADLVALPIVVLPTVAALALVVWGVWSLIGWLH